ARGLAPAPGRSAAWAHGDGSWPGDHPDTVVRGRAVRNRRFCRCPSGRRPSDRGLATRRGWPAVAPEWAGRSQRPRRRWPVPRRDRGKQRTWMILSVYGARPDEKDAWRESPKEGGDPDRYYRP